MLPYDISPIPLQGARADEDPEAISRLIARQRVWETVHLDDYPCAACALYEMKQMRITSLKIVGRGNTTERKIADVSFFKTLLHHLSHDRPDKKAFREYARALYNRTYNRPCRTYMCHYPSVMD